MSKFQELYLINVNKDVAAKNGFNYLSWTYAWKTLISHEPSATYEVHEFNGLPVMYLKDSSAMVVVSVIVNDVPRKMWLAVTDFKNKAIDNPNSGEIANATMRCLVKAIAMHGLGLYIYAGEDLPQMPVEKTDDDKFDIIRSAVVKMETVEAIDEYMTNHKLKSGVAKMSGDYPKQIAQMVEDRKNEIAGDVSK